MKQIILDFKVALLFVGTIVGAGFASGKELVTFFGGFGGFAIPIAILLGLLFFLTAWLFLQIGNKLRPQSFGSLNNLIFRKFGILMDILMAISYFIVFSAMLAGVEALMRHVFHLNLSFPIFGMITIALAVIVMLKGMNGLLNVNAILVPLILAFVFTASTVTMATPENGTATPLQIFQHLPASPVGMVTNVVLYVCMNMLLTASVLTSVGKSLSKRNIIVGAALGSAMIVACIILILFAIYSSDMQVLASPMPMMYLISKYGIFVEIVASLIIWCGIFTTLISSVFPLLEFSDRITKKRYITLPIILAIGLGISFLGFSGIVDLLYPIMGVIGFFFIVSAVIYYFYIKKSNANHFST